MAPNTYESNDLVRLSGNKPKEKPPWGGHITVQTGQPSCTSRSEAMDIEEPIAIEGSTLEISNLKPHPCSVSLIVFPVCTSEGNIPATEGNSGGKKRAKAPQPFGGGVLGKSVSINGKILSFDSGHVVGASLGGPDHHDHKTEGNTYSRPSLTTVPQQARWQRNGLWKSLEDRVKSWALAQMNLRNPYNMNDLPQQPPPEGLFLRVVVSKERYGTNPNLPHKWEGDIAQEPAYYQFVMEPILFGKQEVGYYDSTLDITFVEGRRILNIPCYRMMLDGNQDHLKWALQHSLPLPTTSIEDTKLAYLDFETSGLDPRRNAVIQSAWQVSKGRSLRKSYASLHDPAKLRRSESVEYTQAAEQTHGIRQEQLSGQPSLEDSIRELNAESPEIILAYNASFDLEFMLDGLGFMDVEFQPKPVLDVLKAIELVYDLAKKHDKTGILEFYRIDQIHAEENAPRKDQHKTLRPSFRLGKVYSAFFQRPLNGAHDALHDVEATKAVFDKVVEIANTRLRDEYFPNGVTWQSLKPCFEPTLLDSPLVTKLRDNQRATAARRQSLSV